MAPWFFELAYTNFHTIIRPMFEGKNIRFLEIGCFEGDCTRYMFENVLTNHESKVVVIDPFENSSTHSITYERFQANLLEYFNRIKVCRGFSHNILPTLENDSFDFIYIDGDHTSNAVYKDAVLSFPLLKTGGIMLFDDYLWLGGSYSRQLTDELNCHMGINRFIEEYKNRIEIVVKNYQLMLCKME